MERVYTTPLLDKLGIRPGMRVAIIDIDDPDIRLQIADRTTDLTEGWPEPDTDVVLLRRRFVRVARTAQGPGGADPLERRDLGRLAQGQDEDAARCRRHRGGEGGPTRRQQGRVVLGHPHGHQARHPGRTPPALAALYHRPMGSDVLIILIVILVAVLVCAWSEDPAEMGLDARARLPRSQDRGRQGAGRDPGTHVRAGRADRRPRRPAGLSRPTLERADIVGLTTRPRSTRRTAPR